jgi:hypothetical protein
MTPDDIRSIVHQVLAEERQAQVDTPINDAVVLKVVSAILTGFGINDDDRKAIREDFVYLRRWRETSDKIQNGGWIALMTVLVSGLCAALYMGIKTLLAK